jgi:hypothetical protein
METGGEALKDQGWAAVSNIVVNGAAAAHGRAGIGIPFVLAALRPALPLQWLP